MDAPVMPELFSDDEVQTLLLAILHGRPDGVDETEVRRCLAWAERARIGDVMLTSVLDGRVAVDWPEEVGAGGPRLRLKEATLPPWHS